MCEEADKSLNAMVKSIAPLPLLQKLRGCVDHGNLRVRAKAAVSISNSVSKMVNLPRKTYMETSIFICFRTFI